MHYIILHIFSQFIVAPTGCIIGTMDLKFFANTIMLLKVDCFEGFSNWSNFDKLVINSTSQCNCKNYKLNTVNREIFMWKLFMW